MRRLVIMRHAMAADWSERGGDAGRPLTEAGRATAYAQGVRLKEAGLTPDRVVASASVRTRETAAAACAGAGLAPDLIVTDERVYEASVAELEAVLLAHDVRGAVWLVGHQPGVGSLTAARTGDPLDKGMAPADVAVLAPDAGVATGWRLVSWLRAADAKAARSSGPVH